MSGTPAAPQPHTAKAPAEFDPRLWLRKVDPRTRRPYFVHRRTGRTTWDVALRTAADTSAAASPLLFGPASALFRAAVPVNTGAEPSSSASSLNGAASAEVDGGAVRASALEPRETPPPAASASTSPSPTAETKPITDTAESAPEPRSTSTTSTPQPAPSTAGGRVPKPALNLAACSTVHVPYTLETSVPETGHAPETSPLGAAAASTAAAATAPPAARAHDAPHGAGSPPSAAASPTSQPLVRDAAAGGGSSTLLSTTHARPHAPGNPPSLGASSPLLPCAGPAPDASVESRSLTQTFRGPDTASSASAAATATPRVPLSSPSSTVGVSTPSRVRLAESLDAARDVRHAGPPLSPTADLPAETGGSGPGPGDAAAAEEWRLTRRTWDLEEERARVESELALLRGPVEVEAQSIAEEHDRLLEEQRALQTAATLAVQEQQTKRADLANLQRRLADLRQQQRDGAALLTSLHERRDTLQARAAALDEETAQLADERHRLEATELPAEDRQLRACQTRLAAARRRTAEQEEVLRARQQALERRRDAVQELHRRLDAVTACSGVAPLRDGDANQRGTAGVKAAPHAGRDGAPLAPAARRVSATGTAVPVGDPANGDGRQGELRARLETLQREAAAFDTAARALYESDVVAHQEHAMRAATRRVKDLTEVWTPTLKAAEEVLGELQRHAVTQSHKHKGAQHRLPLQPESEYFAQF